MLSGAIGGGDGFRLVVPPDDKEMLRRNDSVRAGPIVLGPGVGVQYHLGPHAALVADLRAFVGAPEFATVVDFNTGAQIGF